MASLQSLAKPELGRDSGGREKRACLGNGNASGSTGRWPHAINKLAATVLLVAAGGGAAHAWGPLGHRIVAETAALMVRDDLPRTWGPIFARHRFDLGVYAFVPDARFRHVDGHDGKLESPTHYRHLDARSGAEPGSVERRVAQFLARGREQLGPVRAPVGGYVAGATAQGDVRRIWVGLVELGVMAHYSGDAAMPYHATADWNGHAAGQGGIHFYFENDCVDAFEPGLAEDVLKAARKRRASWMAQWNAAGAAPEALVTAVLKDSLAAVGTLAATDRRHAVIQAREPGSTADASRKPPPEGCRAMRALLVERLAKGAVLTAVLWESALPREGVDFSGAAGLQFSDADAAPAYVPPSR
jgi:hypothetical protein